MANVKQRKHLLAKKVKIKPFKKHYLKESEQQKKPRNNLSRRDMLSVVLSIGLSYFFCTIFFKMMMLVVEATAEWNIIPFILMVIGVTLYIVLMVVFYRTCRPYTDRLSTKLADNYNKRKEKRLLRKLNNKKSKG